MITAGVWSLAGIALILLLASSARNRTSRTCNGFNINISGSEEGQWFLDKSDIINVLTANNTRKLKGRSLQEFNLAGLERKLEKSVWVDEAELFFDDKAILQVKIRERIPAIRVFAMNGSSFFIDSSGKKLPVSLKTVVSLPVFTGFPNTGKEIHKKDSLLVRDMLKLGKFIAKDPFWMAQIEQLHITRNNFELVPMIGDHRIELGNAEDHERKFRKLGIFYRQIIPKTGLNRYSLIRLQFSDQVVAVKKEGIQDTNSNDQPLTPKQLKTDIHE